MRWGSALSATLLLLATGLAALGCTTRSDVKQGPTARTEVLVLSTLHQHHPRVPRYGYAELTRIIELLEPDVLALELSAEDLAERRPQRAKQEFPNSVYPLLDRRPLPTVALEPADPVRSGLIGMMAGSQQRFFAETPDLAQAFIDYNDLVLGSLLDGWRSVCDVNSSRTDAIFAAKHRLQDAIQPSEQAAAWDGWNQTFLQRITDAARRFRGQRIVVVVGVEHGYWLRQHLAMQPDLTLLDPAEQLPRRLCQAGDGD